MMRRPYSFLFAVVLCARLPLWGQQYVSSSLAGSPAATTTLVTALASGGNPTSYPGTLNSSGTYINAGTVSIGDGGAAAAAALQGPSSVVYYNGYTYILEAIGSRVRQIDGSGVITTIAGTGASGYAGDGGAANTANFSVPEGLAIDSVGNFYVADTTNFVVREFQLGGGILTMAGTPNITGYTGDGGPATSAELVLPRAVAADAAGNIYIVDANAIRVVTGNQDGSNGIITTFAGSATASYSGDGGPASLATFNQPQALAIDASGNIYVADTFNFRIRKIGTNGIITTVAGNGSSGYSGDGGPATSAQFMAPTGLAVDAAGNLYVADLYRVRKVSASGVISTIAGNGIQGYLGDGGVATSSELNSVNGLGVDPSGNVYVCDTGNNVVRMESPGALSVITNAASNLPGPVVPGELVVIYGPNLSIDTTIMTQILDFTTYPQGQVDPDINGLQVFFNSVAAPILYESTTQVAAIVPYYPPGFAGTATVEVVDNTATTAVITVPIAASEPEFFTANSSGTGQAAALNQNGSANSAASPASAGQVVVFFVTGDGIITTPGADGIINALVLPLPHPVLPVSATVGGLAATVQYAGEAPGAVQGVMQLNLLLPAGVPTGSAVPVKVTVGTATSQANVTIAIH
jgi:uncharacterized protein (TIGR03437 family)